MKRVNVIIFFILAVAASAFAVEAKSPAVLLQQGIYAEETEGNLDKAMGIYSQIRSDYNDVERISAIATYQLGMCNLKKDKKQEAIKLFQEVVDYFPEQTVAAKKAQQQLDKLGVKNDSGKNIFDMLGQASSFIGSKYGEVCAEAGMKKLYSNSHIYVVDKNFVFRGGGMGYAMNWTNKPITGKYRLSGTTHPNQKLYDVMNEPIDIEIVPDANRSGFYNVYWTPKEPFLPGGFFSYGWETDRSRALAKTEQGYQLKMNNHFGDRCVETFFLAVPEGMQIVSKSEEYTGKNTISGWDIYWWKKEVPRDTDHTVNITLNDVDPAPILDIVPAKVRECIVNSFHKTFEIAQKKGLRTNNHIHIIDQSFNRNFGLIQIFHNSTNQVIEGEVRLGSNDTPDIYLYNEKGIKQEIRTVKIPGSNYDLFWTPSEPIKPDEMRMLCYSLGENKLYTDPNNQYILRMKNHFGSPVIENFYVVLPANIELASQSEPFTNYETVEGFKIYCWSKEQEADAEHTVNVTLTDKKTIKPLKLEAAPKAISFYPKDGDVNVPYGQSQIRIGFDKAMDPNIARLFFKDSQIYPDQHKFNYDASKKEFIFYFTLKPNSHYVVYADKIWGTFKDANGQSSEGFEFSFDTTGFSSNAANKPKVVSISPASGAIWNKFTTLQVQFDRPVIPYSGKLTFTPESSSSGIMPLTPSNEQATTTLTLPLILSTSGKLIISDFISESGATSEPYEIEFALSSKSLSAEKEDSLRKFETDTNFISLIESIQKTSKEITSVSETVFTTSISDNSFRAEYGLFRFQRSKQFYCDISGTMNIPFKIGSDGQNCWFFSDSTEQRKNGEIRFYMTPCSDVNDIDIKFVRPFSTRKEPVAIIRSNKLEYIGKETVSNTQCEVIRSYRFLNDHFPRITTYWFDAEKFLPVRIIQTDTNKYQFDFVYDNLNTAIPDKQFQYDGPDSYTAEKPEALDEGYTERSIIVHDGSDGRMSGRWGKKGPKGTSSSGLN